MIIDCSIVLGCIDVADLMLIICSLLLWYVK